MYIQQQQQHVIYARGMGMQDAYGDQRSRGNSLPPNGPGTPGQRPSQPPPAPPSNNSENRYVVWNSNWIRQIWRLTAFLNESEKK